MAGAGMLLSDLFQQLSVGPLQDLAIAGAGTGTVPVENYPKIMVPVNQALIALYTRFPLHKKSLILEAVDGISTYWLQTDFAQTSASAEPNKYIQDTVEDPFLGDVLQVTGIFDSEHCPLPLNDKNDCKSWFTPTYDALLMDYAVTGDRYYVEFHARHARLDLAPVDPGLVTVRVPPVLETAFMYCIAGYVYGVMNMEGAVSRSQEFHSRYDALCQFVEERNTLNNFTDSSNMKPELGGWV